MRRIWKRKLIISMGIVAIWVLMTAIWGWIWYEYYAEVIQIPFYRRGNWMVIAIYGILLGFINQFYGGYKVSSYRRGDLIFSGVLSMIVVNVITYFQISVIGRDWMQVTPVVWMSVVDFFLIWIWATLINLLYLRINPPRKLLMVYGGNEMANSLENKFSGRTDKYDIVETIDIGQGMAKVIECTKKHKAILICDVKSNERNQLLKFCYENRIRAYITPKISDILIRGSIDIHLFDSPLLLSRNEGLSLGQLMCKRAIDIGLSLLGLIVFCPFMGIICAAIKLEDRGPVLYKQLRLTRNGEVFWLYKFRSMIPDAEKKSGARLSSGENDARITRVGRIIRAIRFDELPQLINILKGEMSVVGPRPERPEIATQYKKTMPEFDFRLMVKAGLTGYAQVNGKYNTTPYDKLKMDLAYISNYSLLLDLQLILQTVKTLFSKSSTEGVEEDSEWKMENRK